MLSSKLGRALLPCGLAIIMLSSCGGEPSAPNQPPEVVLEPNVAARTYTVGDTVFFTVLAQDPDGDALTFSYTWRAENTLTTIETARLIPSAQSATLSWTPDSGDITGEGAPLELIFVVEDARGAQTQRRVDLTIVPGNGTPRFESSANQIYRGCCDQPLSFEVRVRDDDSARVNLSMLGGLDGAMFEQTGDKKGRFSWQPSAAQGMQRLHTARFIADDGQNPPVPQDVTIVIYSGEPTRPVNPAQDVCVGERLISHVPLSVSRDATRRELSVEATLTQAAVSRYDLFAISWSADRDPTTDPTAVIETEDMVLEGLTLRASLPNLGVVSGQESTLYYKICMIDVDSPDSDPTSFVCVPSADALYYGARSYPATSAMCRVTSPNDAIDRASSLNAGLGSWDGFYLCPEREDFHVLSVRAGQTLQLTLAAPLGAALNVALLDEAQADVSSLLRRSDCAGITTATLSVPEGGASRSFYVRVSGDEIAYQIIAQAVGDSAAACTDSALEPNDLPGQASPLAANTMLDSLELCPSGADRDMYALTLRAGELVEVVLRHDASAANLDLELYSPAQPAAKIGQLGEGVAFTFAFDDDEETLRYEARQCGEHKLMVFSNDGPAAYGLTTRVMPGACQDDDEFGAMCNHTRAQASIFAWNTSYALKLCAGGEDWFRHRGNSAVVLGEVSAMGGGAIAGMTFEVYGPGGELLEVAAPEQGKLALLTEFEDDDWYTFRVTSRDAVSYTLNVID